MEKDKEQKTDLEIRKETLKNTIDRYGSIISIAVMIIAVITLIMLYGYAHEIAVGPCKMCEEKVEGMQCINLQGYDHFRTEWNLKENTKTQS